jgi:hypothetical protein
MSGKAAAFGGRMMNAAGDQILKQFAANFAALVQAPQAQPAADAADAPVPEAAAPQAGLNGLALAWAMLRDWVRGIFARKAT